jgi:hypothetical protein
MCEKQQGASFTFGTDGGSWNFINIGRLSNPIPVIDDTHLASEGNRESCPGELGDPQMITLTLQNDGNQAWPTKGLVQTGTITHPLGEYDDAETHAGTGFVVDIRTAEFQSATEGIQTIEVDWKFDGKTGPTRTLAAND